MQNLETPSEDPIRTLWVKIIKLLQDYPNLFENLQLVSGYWSGTSNIWNLAIVSLEQICDILQARQTDIKNLKKQYGDAHVSDIFDLLEPRDSNILVSRLEKNSTNLIIQNRQNLIAIFDKSEKTPQKRYELEYDIPNDTNADANYNYLTPLMIDHIFEKIVWPISDLKEKLIIDVWAWSGDFVKRMVHRGVSTEGIIPLEPSVVWSQMLKKYWFSNTFQGFSTEYREDKKFDYVFLSYFVDRDQNQKATFEHALGLLPQSWGMLVFEGLLPCVSEDTQGVSYVQDKNTLVTSGVSICDDVTKIIDYCCNHASSLGLQCIEKHITVWYRFVHSMDGKEMLPSVIIMMKFQSTS